MSERNKRTLVQEFRTEIDGVIKALVIPVEGELVDRLTEIRDRSYRRRTTWLEAKPGAGARLEKLELSRLIVAPIAEGYTPTR